MQLITLKTIRSREPKPCYDPTRYVDESWTGTALDVLRMKQVPAEDRLWAVLHEDAISSEVMRTFARWCALQVIHLWDAPQIVIHYLETGDESVMDAAWDAAWAAGRDATWDAAWAAAANAVWAAATARDAVWAAATARDAGRDAAANAAWAATWDAAWAAAANVARAAGRDAATARAVQVEKLIEMLNVEKRTRRIRCN